MYSSADRISRNINEEIDIYNSKAKKYNDCVMNSKSFWKSNNGNSYRGEYTLLMIKLFFLSRKYNYIEAKFSRLSNRISKAIDERRRQAYLESLAVNSKK